jgi:hypothetical protein
MEGSFLPFLLWIWILVGTPVMTMLLSGMTRDRLN